MVGFFARSKAGHDKENIYMIIKTDEKYVYLADGKLKTLEEPKRKNKKHIQIIRQFNNKELECKLKNSLKVYNHEIKTAIKLYAASNQI